MNPAQPGGTQEVEQPIAESWTNGVMAIKVETQAELEQMFFSPDGKMQPGDRFVIVLDRLVHLDGGAFGIGFKFEKLQGRPQQPQGIATPDKRILVPGR